MSQFDTAQFGECCGQKPVGWVEWGDCGCEKEVLVVRCPLCFLKRRAYSFDRLMKLWKEADRK